MQDTRRSDSITDPHALLACLADHVSDAVLLVDLGSRSVRYCNPAAETLVRALGPTGQESSCAWLMSTIPDEAFAIAVRGLPWQGDVSLDGNPGDDSPRLWISVHPAFEGPQPTVARPGFVIMRTPGDSSGLIEELQRRHTELVSAYSRLTATQESMLQHEKMASTGRLAAGVAHEINNPIGYVHSNLGTLKEYVGTLVRVLTEYDRILRDTPASEPWHAEIGALRQRHDIDYVLGDLPQLLDESHEGITRVRRIVQDLKDFSRSSLHDEWKATDIHRCLDSTLNIVASEIKYKGRVQKEYGELPPVECLASELGQVFMNILVNAAQAIPEQGVIRIATSRPGDDVLIEISDNGVGIPAENLAHVFDPFFTTKPVGQGTGLGLSIAYGIVTKHNGRIEVTSIPGEGTTFRIQLPVRQGSCPGS